MKFQETPLKGAWIITPEQIEDERGFFARMFSIDEMNKYGMETDIVQTSMAFNKKRGTLRGMHFQAPPHEEAKYVQCVRGAAYDVIIDLRAGSLTQKKWFGIELSEENRHMLYIPRGFAHGYLTTTDDAELHYSMTTKYVASASKGVRWNDPALSIHWPFAPAIISAKDSKYPPVGEHE